MFNTQLFKKLKRGPQVVVLKDAAIVSAFIGLQSGDRVIDCGAGSGFLAIYLGSIVAPSGRVYSYERREEFASLAAKNVEKAGLASVVEIKNKDAVNGFEEKDVDLVTLDCGDSHLLLEHAFAALKKEGYCIGFLPNVEQVKTFAEKASEAGFKLLGTHRLIDEEWLIRPQGCRPENTGLMHTSFLCFLRK